MLWNCFRGYLLEELPMGSIWPSRYFSLAPETWGFSAKTLYCSMPVFCLMCRSLQLRQMRGEFWYNHYILHWAGSSPHKQFPIAVLWETQACSLALGFPVRLSTLVSPLTKGVCPCWLSWDAEKWLINSHYLFYQFLYCAMMEAHCHL